MIRFIADLFKRDETGAVPRWLGPLNFFVLQWFWFRLAVEIDPFTGERTGWSIVLWAPLTRWVWR